MMSTELHCTTERLSTHGRLHCAANPQKFDSRGGIYVTTEGTEGTEDMEGEVSLTRTAHLRGIVSNGFVATN